MWGTTINGYLKSENLVYLLIKSDKFIVDLFVRFPH